MTQTLEENKAETSEQPDWFDDMDADVGRLLEQDFEVLGEGTLVQRLYACLLCLPCLDRYTCVNVHHTTCWSYHVH